MFLNALVTAGFPGLLLVMAITITMLKIALDAYRTSRHRSDSHWMGLGLLGGVVGFFLNSQFHNNGIFNEAAMLWWMIGIASALIAVSHSTMDVSAPGSIE